jgi:hypothetical protein
VAASAVAFDAGADERSGERRWGARDTRKEKGEGRKARVAVMGQHPFEWVRQMWGTAGEGVPRGERGMGGAWLDSGGGRLSPALERRAQVGGTRHGHAARPVRGRGVGWLPSGPSAIVPGGTGQKRFKLFQNSNGSKMFNCLQTLIDPNLTFSSTKKLK